MVWGTQESRAVVAVVEMGRWLPNREGPGKLMLKADDERCMFRAFLAHTAPWSVWDLESRGLVEGQSQAALHPCLTRFDFIS